MKKRGRFITFEGIDGSGKSTNLSWLAGQLQLLKHKVVQTREPGGTPFGERARDLLLATPMPTLAETLFFASIRAAHVEQVILPALEAGAWVLCDRFLDATWAYQGGGRGVHDEVIGVLEAISTFGLRPDLTFFLDGPEDVLLLRAKEKNRFEEEGPDFFSKVRAKYLERVEKDPARFCVLDATLCLGETQGNIAGAMLSRFGVRI